MAAAKEAPKEEVKVLGEGADKTVRNHVIGSMGVGLIPVPVVDLVALTGVQLNMLRKLAKSYNVPFSKDKVKNILASLIGGTVPVTFSSTLASLVKSIPIVGQTTGALSMPILAGATTYAVGKVFTQHFASGGTFLNFNPEEVKEYYAQMFKEGEKIASDLKKSDDTKK
ncbi:MAG: DUF697 domain-containing protein [Desulfobacterales bacterium]|nr:DUF697 domain-containing protein [Desulfobacterales bacterium]